MLLHPHEAPEDEDVLIFNLIALFLLLASPSNPPDLVRSLDRAELSREENLSGYTVMEHYTVRNSRLQDPAEMTVETVYKRGEGKTFKVLLRSGPSVLQNSVLDRLLASEREMSQGATRQHALVTTANYDIRPAGDAMLGATHCKLLELVPHAKSPFLIKGKAWLNADDYSLMRLEGKPTASPSFFAGHPYIVRDYIRVDGFTVAARSQATSQSLLLGKTEVTITYQDYRIER